VVLFLTASFTTSPLAQSADPPRLADPTRPTGIWVLAKNAMDFDADVLSALAPECTATQGVNPSGKLVLALTCPGYSAEVHPQFVMPRELVSFRNAMLSDLSLSAGARMLHGGFTSNHPVAAHVNATSQVINVYFPKGLGADDRAKDLVRAVARKSNGLIYAWSSVYQPNGTHLLWMDGAPASF